MPMKPSAFATEDIDVDASTAWTRGIPINELPESDARVANIKKSAIVLERLANRFIRASNLPDAGRCENYLSFFHSFRINEEVSRTHPEVFRATYAHFSHNGVPVGKLREEPLDNLGTGRGSRDRFSESPGATEPIRTAQPNRRPGIYQSPRSGERRVSSFLRRDAASQSKRASEVAARVHRGLWQGCHEIRKPRPAQNLASSSLPVPHLLR